VSPAPPNVSKLIDEFFEQNAADLEAEGTHALSPWIREVARLQAQLYWIKLRGIAEKVTDTEVKLQLPAQMSPTGRVFAIEGVVDIVRDDGKVTMYDIKTHDSQYIRDNIGEYEKQLNVYAHIWQNLRGEPLDETAVICTQLPKDVENAYKANDAKAFLPALSNWDPVIPVDFDTDRVSRTISEFGAIVDRIESHDFAPPAAAKLREMLPGTRTRFAIYVCRNCDARYSCRSYQEYAKVSRSAKDNQIAHFLNDYGDEDAQEDFTLAALDVPPPLDFID
jgi:hypothetical protein